MASVASSAALAGTPAAASFAAVTAPALDAILLLEQPFAHLPYDQLASLLRTQQRLLQRELDLTHTSLLELATASTRTDPETAAAHLDTNIKRLRALKRRLNQLNAQTKTSLNTASSRYAHLQDLHAISSTADPAFESWSHTRLNRILVDYMLRQGANTAAAHLTQSASMAPLVDTAVFAEINKIEASLYPPSTSAAVETTEPCARALAWCAENRPALEAVNSRLEFDLRMQVYIELARNRTTQSLRQAIAYLRSHLIPMSEQDSDASASAAARRTSTTVMDEGDDEHLPDESLTPAHSSTAPHLPLTQASKRKQVSRALGLLACSPSSPAYSDLYHQDRWASLRALFRSYALQIHSLPPQPMLHIALSAGLSSLKLPACYAQDASALMDAEAVLHESAAGAAAALGGQTARAVQRAVEVSIPVPPNVVDPVPLAAALTTGDAGGLGAIATTTARRNQYGLQPTQHRGGSPVAKQNPDCPICERDGLGTLAREVPWSHHENSTIVCRLGGHLMSEDDPPMCLPNGRVYSRSALEELALKSADGQTVVDPRTGESYSFASLRKMYIS